MMIGPKVKDRRHRSYGEDADEPRGLIDTEATDVEMEHPFDDTEPVEQIEEEPKAPPTFEE